MDYANSQHNMGMPQTGAAGANYRTPQPGASPESPISRELDSLAKSIAELELVVESVQARLQPVLMIRQSGSASPVPNEAQASAGIVGDAIASSSCRVRNLIRALSQMRDNLAI